MKKLLVSLGLLMLIAAGLYFLNRPSPVSVRLVDVQTGQVEQLAANSRAGTVRACRRSRLSMPQGGRVEQLLVDEGAHVEQGQPLLELWNADLKARLEEVAATLKAREIQLSSACHTAALAQREARRAESLAKNRLASEELLDQRQTEARRAVLACDEAQAVTEQARATLKLHQVLLDNTILKAPFAGIIAEINGEIGEYVTPSPPGVATPPAVDLIDDSCLYVRAPIDEVEASRLEVGQRVRITLDAFRGRHFDGQLTRIAPFVSEVEKQARTVDVDVNFTPPPHDAHLLVGYSADIEVIIEQRDDVLRVPTETLLQGNRVLRYDANLQTLEDVHVETGLGNWTWTEILSGLSAGDRILRSLDAAGAEAGARVEPAP
ncbi:efflux RND transporter periplasmic adaptor subunit [Marinobacterium sediminicola]|uniref:HlyD family secretion protein n=1 Tax=Marinobacterium sediminicola TaxID=518898 RepID=A0ABY1S497_9GAMM|nr:efflux RND transporter periplasmic adaptor subunit [Marinobacterium sediminicola]ULG69851.1 efflux RND transporter periplasmic adaptor subunit [Marinobacterium sediminicola]SMR77869.1 HlyD family secretion protein [Marinobacterium sediminicola]